MSLPQDIERIEFTIFDTETTGLDPADGDRIVEIAGLRIRGDEELGSFQSLINPGREISPAAFAVNKISAQMLKDAPRMAEVMPKFLSFIRGSCLCSYNAGFDMEFLQAEMNILGQSFPSDLMVLDILKMSRRLLPGIERHALWFVAQQLGIRQTQEHRALSDVKITYAVFRKLKEILRHKGVTDFENFSRLFALNAQVLQDLIQQRISQIQEAMDLGVKLKIKYLSSSSVEVTEREVIPKEIRKERNQAYLVGYCCLRNDERSFRVDGILHVEVV